MTKQKKDESTKRYKIGSLVKKNSKANNYTKFK